MKTINIAIDIDDFLTSMEITKLKKQDSLDPIHHGEGSFFTIHFTYDKREYDIENVLVPGCIPFFQFLFEHQQVRPAFFSAGVRARNLVLAEKVVQLAIDAGGDPTWMDRYDVFSREDCFDTEALPREMGSARKSPYQPPDRFGNLKKDLRMIHYGREAYHALFARACGGESVLLPAAETDNAMLEHTILIEEDPSYLFPGQQKNMLLCPTYEHPYTKLENYQQEDTPIADSSDYRDRFKYTNTIFYAAGVMHHVFERCQSGTSSIPDILWEAQGHLWASRDVPSEKRFPLHFFTEGRTVLRKYNPALNFAVAAPKEGDDR
jgi:hypothetical protein